MLQRIEMLQDYRVLKTGQVFDFNPGVNLLVGEQGSGKSSLIQLLHFKRDKLARFVTKDGEAVATRSFDFEKDNPRLGHRIETMTQLVCVMVSHGQMVEKMLRELQDEKDKLIIMDEPDMALSIRSCYKLIDYFKTAVNNGCQIIAAVHNPIIINGFDEVYSMEHRKRMTSKEFIQCHTP